MSSAIALLANSVLLIGLHKSKLTSQKTMKIICSLACSDLGVAALVMPTYLAALYNEKTGCKIHTASALVFFSFGMNTASMLLILSLDRFLQISWPFFYRAWVTQKQVTILICVTWMVSPVTATCVLFTSPLTQICILLTIGMTFYLVSVTFYARILYVIHAHKKKIRTGSLSISCKNGKRKWPIQNNPISTLSSLDANSKKITFKLQVEVFDDSIMISDENGCSVEQQSNAARSISTAKTRLHRSSDDHKIRKGFAPPHGKGAQQSAF